MDKDSNITLEKIDDLLATYANKNVIMVTHQNPDGDGLAALMALSLCLRHIYHAIPYIVMDSTFPTFLDYLGDNFCPVLTFADFIATKITLDLLLVIDCHEVDRVDTDPKIFDHAERVVVIDHHIAKPQSLKPNFAYYIDSEAASTGVIIDRFLHKYFLQNDYSWKKNYADCIYTTIINDTDNFLNSNSDYEAYTCSANLIKLGLQPNVITHELIYKKPIAYFQFIGEVLSSIELHTNRKIALYYATTEMLTRNGQTTDAYSKLMKWTKGAFDVDIQVLICQYEPSFYRLSLRSEKYDVQVMAKHFGGGGHVNASGFAFKGDLDAAKLQVIEYIESIIS